MPRKLLTRRRLLTAGLAAATLVLPSRKLVRPTEAWPRRGSISGLPPPPGAAEAGLTSLNFHEPFEDSGSIDMGLTGNPGFKWYLLNRWPNTLNNTDWSLANNTTPSDISVSNSMYIQTTGRPNTAQAGIHTARADPVLGWRGTTFINSFFVDFEMSINPYSHGTNANFGVAIWAFPMEAIAFGANLFTEIDFFERFTNETTLQSVGDWVASPQSSFFNGNNVWGAAPTDTGFHRYSTRMITSTSTFGAGTGSIVRYLDGVAQPSLNVTWTAGQHFARNDTQRIMMIINTGENVVLQMKYFDVWQELPSDMLVQ